MLFDNMQEIISIPGFSDPFSSMTHLFAATFFLLLGVRLIASSPVRGAKNVSLYVFVFSVVFLLSMSGVFHLLSPNSSGREVLQRLDHAAIFILIAGSFTPTHILLFKGWQRWLVLVFVWLAAITSITLKTIFFHEMPEWFSLILYLGLGWVGTLSAYLIHHHQYRGLNRFLALGALAYTVGAVLEFSRYPVVVAGVIGSHEIFHLFVIAGISMHWWMVLRVARLSAGQNHGKIK